MKYFILSIIFFLSFNLLFAQKIQFQVGTQIPLTYSAGIEYSFTQKISLNLQGGIMTKPFDVVLLNVLKMFGTDAALVNTIGEAFNYGASVQVTPKFNFDNYYAGVYYSYFSLEASDVPKDAIEAYYGITLPRRNVSRVNNFVLKSDLHNVGLLFGRRFSFKNPHLGLCAEISVAKTFASQSKLTADFGDLNRISPLIDDELNKYYLDYGYLPSLNLFFVYKLGKMK